MLFFGYKNAYQSVLVSCLLFLVGENVVVVFCVKGILFYVIYSAYDVDDEWCLLIAVVVIAAAVVLAGMIAPVIAGCGGMGERRGQILCGGGERLEMKYVYSDNQKSEHLERGTAWDTACFFFDWTITNNYHL